MQRIAIERCIMIMINDQEFPAGRGMCAGALLEQALEQPLRILSDKHSRN
jgi:hypothetical protein